ncbi:hypothetical protein [Microtetraspora niveoalba]|uniref:hypothetical protein n=1 Tax=Microtetraspora niveoalba TaxID=46175 RepID=UPI000AB04F7A|nr:hypothetical protein [Microtetraspora niveoalba]
MIITPALNTVPPSAAAALAVLLPINPLPPVPAPSPAVPLATVPAAAPGRGNRRSLVGGRATPLPDAIPGRKTTIVILRTPALVPALVPAVGSRPRPRPRIGRPAIEHCGTGSPLWSTGPNGIQPRETERGGNGARRC